MFARNAAIEIAQRGLPQNSVFKWNRDGKLSLRLAADQCGKAGLTGNA
jgi:hypothetical protein